MTRFRTRLDAMQSARGGWLCLMCRATDTEKRKANICGACGNGSMHFFPSQKELKRSAELLLAERAGAISRLRFHPRYELAVKGTTITTYVADAEYLENAILVVEDTKPRGGNRDPVAALKIKLWEALFKPLKVRIV